MKLIIESTDEIVLVQTASGACPARVWRGLTIDSGVDVICLVASVGVHEDTPPHVVEEFARTLEECTAYIPGHEITGIVLPVDCDEDEPSN